MAPTKNPEQAGPGSGELPVVDWERLLALAPYLGGSDAIVTIVEDFNGRFPVLLAAVRRQAAVHGCEHTRRAFHELANEALNVRAERLAEVCHQAEQVAVRQPAAVPWEHIDDTANVTYAVLNAWLAAHAPGAPHRNDSSKYLKI